MSSNGGGELLTLSILGLPVAFPRNGRITACLKGVPKPGPCPGPRRLRKLLPGKPKHKPGIKPKAPKAPRAAKPDTKAMAARERKVEQSVGKALSTLATDKIHTGPGGVWNPDRDAVHREIVNDLYAKAADVPNEGRAVIAGGLGGAGKSTVLRDHADIDPNKYLTINPDDIKEELAKRDLIPTIPGAEDLTPMERAALVHEESSRIAHMLANKAYHDKKNVIWDITMSSPSSVKSRVDALKTKGYDQIQGIFVDIPVEVSVKRALARYHRGLDDWSQGKGQGGRFVPPAIIRAQRTASGSTVNRATFEDLKPIFHDWRAYDNSVDGRPPKLIARRS